MLQRIGVSLDEDLLNSFDSFISAKGYENRSEAIRDLIREKMVEQEWRDSSKPVMAILAYVYDHHQSDLSQKLAEEQHHHFASIISNLHVHMDHDNCLEMMVLKGKPKHLRNLANGILSVRGVKFGRLVPATSGSDIP